MIREAFLSLGLLSLVACAGSEHSTRAVSPNAADSGLGALDPSSLVVTSGEITRVSATRFETSSGAMRAQRKGKGPDVAELRFHFRGPTEDDVPLSSGEIRRQIGLKLRAQDGCNVVYAMWHIEPSRGLSISVKSNPDKHESSACGDGGYTFLEAREEHEVQEIEADSEHTLRAAIAGKDLQVYADGKLSWVAELPEEALGFDGPAGVRTDNGIFDMEFRVGDAARP
ncbi:MAG TPA: hypothetical protein VFN67_27590 [Polyangiales bacterium]|nr:hypothetical protein [Polyangiales bacterium]